MFALTSLLLVTVQGVAPSVKVLPAWGRFDSVTFQTPVPLDWPGIARRSISAVDLLHPDSATLKGAESPFGGSSSLGFHGSVPEIVPGRYYYVLGPGAWQPIVPEAVTGFVRYDLKDQSWTVERTFYHGLLSARRPASWPDSASPAFVVWSATPQMFTITSVPVNPGKESRERVSLDLIVNGRSEHFDLWEFDSAGRLYRPINSFGPPDRAWLVRSRAIPEMVILEWRPSDLCTAAFGAYVLGARRRVLATSGAECAD